MDVGDKKMKKTFKISGMHCKSCAKLIESILEENEIEASVDFESRKAKIIYDEEKINIDKIISLLKKEGYIAS